jgi:hypothetical protein
MIVVDTRRPSHVIRPTPALTDPEDLGGPAAVAIRERWIDLREQGGEPISIRLFRKDVDHRTAIEAEDGIAVQDVLRLTAWVNCADAGITIEPIWSAVPDDRFGVP